MPRVQLRILAAMLALATLLIPTLIPTASAQNSGIHTYAITNARIVTVAGPVIERGTVVLRNGLIAAVGANVTAPADARVIDGAGLTVYPGLIDSSSSLGIPPPAPTPQPSPGVGSAFALARPAITFSAPNSSQPPGLQPEVLAEDLIRPGGDQIEAARSAGITTVLTSPRQGIWIGQSALVNLAGDTPRQMIVRSPVAMHVGFTPLRTGYPGSLLGVFAALRQMLLDAQRYREAQLVYERNPRGTRRPEQDRSLAALIPVLEGKMPVVMYADREREIRRALDLAQEFKLRAIIAGGLESWKVAGLLSERNVPVLLSLNFPRRTTAPVPEADLEPLRILRERVEAPQAAAKLMAARVRFAFQSGAMANLNDFSANAARTTEHGLSRDDALRAMTLWPAEILGTSTQLGTIEVGKIGNLTVTRGDLLDRNTRVTHVFIDGLPVELRAPTIVAQPGSAAGTWTLNVNLGAGDLAVTLNLEQEGEQLRGALQGPLGSSSIANATISAQGSFRFTVPFTLEGRTQEATFIGRIAGDEMTGSINIVNRPPGVFTGTRPTSVPSAATPPEATELSGTWDINISLGTQDFPAKLTLNQQGGMVSGVLETDFARSEFASGSASSHGFRASSTANIQGQVIDLTIQGKASGNEISGTIESQLGVASFNGRRQP